MKKEITLEFGKDLQRTDKEILETIKKLSKKNSDCYVIYSTSLRRMSILITKRKPSAANALTEHTYRYHGGFFKNGKIEKPSKSFIAKFNFCPVN